MINKFQGFFSKERILKWFFVLIGLLVILTPVVLIALSMYNLFLFSNREYLDEYLYKTILYGVAASVAIFILVSVRFRATKKDGERTPKEIFWFTSGTYNIFRNIARGFSILLLILSTFFFYKYHSTEIDQYKSLVLLLVFCIYVSICFAMYFTWKLSRACEKYKIPVPKIEIRKIFVFLSSLLELSLKIFTFIFMAVFTVMVVVKFFQGDYVACAVSLLCTCVFTYLNTKIE